ncbi:LPS-assembly protein LptD [Derxia lacustris]|uniref:LPS-assembly protein LptD n=1 Tax=Derxia lacustris TaxID=764842 RepID=UPI00111BDA65|nr:LPS-assembly protein LptD [Derxia lacustris]
MTEPAAGSADTAPAGQTVEPGGLRLDRRLRFDRLTATPPEQLPVYLQGARVEGTPERATRVTGDAANQAEVRRGSALLRADSIDFDQIRNTLDADGAVQLYRGGNSYRGPHAFYELDTDSGRLGKGDFTFEPRPAGPAKGVRIDPPRGSADLTEFLGDDLVRLLGVRYTTCTPDNEAWVLRATEIDIDQAAQDGVARNAVVEFGGLPLFATPWMRFPVGDERLSGFLAPTFGYTSSRGIELSTPYYVNLAPNRDYTLTPRLLSKRGLELGNEFRYLGESYNGVLIGNVIDNDRQTGERRWLLRSIHNQDLSQVARGLSGYVNYQRVSDDNYLSDFSTSIVSAANRQLTQEAGLRWNGSNWNATLREQKFQVLQDKVNPVAIPYEREPQLSFKAWRYDVAGFDLNLDADATRFTHPIDRPDLTGAMVTGNRVVAIPSLSYPILAPGAFLTPKLQLNTASYALDRASIPSGSIYEPGYSRAIPTASVDGGLIFERDATLFGRGFVQTLEPRLFYVRTPYHYQAGVPMFDTALADISFAQLFTENAYSGYDRVSDANQLTTAVTTRFLESETGLERFRAALGQRFYFSDRRVGSGTELLSNASKSDYIALVGGDVSNTLSADALLQVDAQTHQTYRSTATVRWRPEPGVALNINYRYLREQLQQYDVGGQFPIGKHWSVLARANYSTLENRLVEGLAGFEYDGCCWVGRIAIQRYATSASTQTTGFFFQLELGGLTRVGNSPLDAVRRNIPGYRPINAGGAPAPAYLQYE